jgi:hypothetical protein
VIAADRFHVVVREVTGEIVRRDSHVVVRLVETGVVPEEIVRLSPDDVPPGVVLVTDNVAGACAGMTNEPVVADVTVTA